jgi:hypothetical protein
LGATIKRIENIAFNEHRMLVHNMILTKSFLFLE